MHFRYMDRGRVAALPDVTGLAQAVRNGVIGPQTLLAVGDEGHFRSAHAVVAYQQVVAGLERNDLGTAPPADDLLPGRQKKWWTRTGVFVLGGGAVLALCFFLARSQVSTLRAVSGGTGAGAEVQVALDRLATEFGDSIARRQQRLEEWLAQRVGQRVQGRALLSPAWLRTLRRTAAGYRGRVDTLQSSISVLASRLILRADSLEGTDGARHGLFAAADEGLRHWERDLSAYAEVQRGVAATLDSLAEFTLARQQSFVIRDGLPVFLSRADAARYQELIAGLDYLASEERRWADNVRARNPNWMLALAPADRPAFRHARLQRSNQ